MLDLSKMGEEVDFYDQLSP